MLSVQALASTQRRARVLATVVALALALALVGWGMRSVTGSHQPPAGAGQHLMSPDDGSQQEEA